VTRTDVHGQPVGEDVPGWTPRPRVRAVALAGRYVALEPLTSAHAAPLHAALGRPEDDALWTYRAQARPVDLPAMQALVAEHLAAAPGLETMVVVPAGDVACGLLSCTRIEPDHGQVEVAGVLYARRLQRTRAATEAVHLVMTHAFDDLGYRRFEWKCDALNEPSRRAALRLGFTFEGVFRRHMVTRGRSRDTAWFSVTVDEWSAVRSAHRAWLAPANFDAEGRQRTRLDAGGHRGDEGPGTA